MGILVFLLVLTLVVAIHEYGHYLACRVTDIRVNKFAVGFGRPLLSRTSKSGTEWSLRWMPLGGFIEPNKEDMDAAHPITKAFVALAGPLANIFPFIVFAGFYGKATAMLKFLSMIYVAGCIALFNVLTLPLRWFAGFTGMSQVDNANTAAQKGADLIGPIGIATEATNATVVAGAGTAALVLFVSLSLGLGLINLVPMPPLDGGRVVLAGVESVIGKSRIGRVERISSFVGAVFMAIILIVITTQDIGRLL